MQGFLPFHSETARIEAERRHSTHPDVCFQRHLMEVWWEREGKREVDLSQCKLVPVTKKQAAAFIQKYEYLGKLGQSFEFAYGMEFEGRLYGVEVFGHASGPNVSNICEGYADRTIGLLRGACITPTKNAGSWLVSRACEAAHREHGYLVFYAYADELAGESGGIYKACNWLYIGQAPGRESKVRYRIVKPDGTWVTERHFTREKMSREQARQKGWKFESVPSKHKYIHFEGDRRIRKRLTESLRYKLQPRNNHETFTDQSGQQQAQPQHVVSASSTGELGS